MKKCNICDNEKPLDQFHKNCKAKDGRQSKCKDCTSSYGREYKQENAMSVKAYQADYFQEHKVGRKLYRREYTKDNPQRKAAHNAVTRALKSGVIEKQEGYTKVEVTLDPIPQFDEIQLIQYMRSEGLSAGKLTNVLSIMVLDPYLHRLYQDLREENKD